MFNITDCIAALRDADTIVSSPFLTEAEKAQLIGALQSCVPPAFNRPYITTITEALGRLYGTYQPAEARPTEGLQDATQVASGPGATITSPDQGTTEGLQEQAQDAGRLDGSGDGHSAPAEAPAEAQKPKHSKVRKQHA